MSLVRHHHAEKTNLFSTQQPPFGKGSLALDWYCFIFSRQRRTTLAWLRAASLWPGTWRTWRGTWGRTLVCFLTFLNVLVLRFPRNCSYDIFEMSSITPSCSICLYENKRQIVLMMSISEFLWNSLHIDEGFKITFMTVFYKGHCNIWTSPVP